MWKTFRRRSSFQPEINEVRILRLVRDQGPISRIEIAAETGLHKATITELVGKLIRAGYLEDTGVSPDQKKVGRRRILLRFLPLAGIVAGIDIRLSHVAVALTDLNARLLTKTSFDYPPAASADEVFGRAATTIKNLFAQEGVPISKLIGIGVGLQGVIDRSSNTLIFSQMKPSWQGKVLGESLESEFAVPVHVENDVKTMAMGEYQFGAAKGARDFVYLWIGEGLGAGIMINGRLLHGITSSAGEVGFNLLESPSFFRENYPLTYHGQTMFGEILSDANIQQSYAAARHEQPGDAHMVEQIVARSVSGDSVALHVLDECASLLSEICIPMVHTLNPDMIVVGGKIASDSSPIGGFLQKKIRHDRLSPPVEAVRVTTAPYADQSVILGAAGLVLHEFFEPMPVVQRQRSRRTASIAG
jgi:N-acetylglucosamine repressor